MLQLRQSKFFSRQTVTLLFNLQLIRVKRRDRWHIQGADNQLFPIMVFQADKQHR